MNLNLRRPVDGKSHGPVVASAMLKPKAVAEIRVLDSQAVGDSEVTIRYFDSLSTTMQFWPSIPAAIRLLARLQPH